MGGNCIDELGAAAGGTVIALEALLEVMPKLTALPQFSKMLIPPFEEITVIIQGFGAVGAHAARILGERLPGVKVVGISDALGYLYEEKGLPVEELFHMWSEKGLVTQQFYKDYIEPPNRVEFFKYSNFPNDLLRENAFCLIPAAPIANYLDIDELSNPSTTTDRMGDWWVIVEGANTYSPDPVRKTSRSRMEREVYRRRGVLIATDYLVNSGGVIFAAQEVMIKTPDSLRIPSDRLGDAKAVDLWLGSHQDGFKSLAEKRRIAAGIKRDDVIRRNMHEFIELLISDLDMLPCEAAEKISVSRIIHSEQYKRVGDLMGPIPTIHLNKTLQEVSVLLVEKGCSIVAVVSEKEELIGVITEWDITRATARGYDDSINIKNIMSKPAICTQADTSILDAIRKLEHHDISAMPVVESGVVKGMISTDLLARNTLYKLLLTNIES
jgi:glutamate dehydrogenase (NAD(P)+)